MQKIRKNCCHKSYKFRKKQLKEFEGLFERSKNFISNGSPKYYQSIIFFFKKILEYKIYFLLKNKLLASV